MHEHEPQALAERVGAAMFARDRASLVALKDVATAMQTVSAGRNNMPPFSGSFTPQQIRDVSAYIVETFAVRTPR